MGPTGASASATANANANATANGNGGGGGNSNANGNGRSRTNANGRLPPNQTDTNTRVETGGNGNGSGGGQGQGGNVPDGSSDSSEPTRFGAGVAFCATFKVGIFSGYKGGPCVAVSFRTEHITFEIETQLLYGGTRHSYDWVFPMSFVIPLTSQWSLFEGLQLRVGGSPIGATFAKDQDGGNYVRFGLHAGLSYELGISETISWRVFDARTFLDFGTREQVDRLGNFLDFGGQLSTGIVL